MDVLLLDDLDKARLSDRAEAELFHVVQYPHGKREADPGNLNATGEQLVAMMSGHRGLPTVRRLRDYCQGICFD